MKLGLLGLGKMGLNLAINMKNNGIDVLSFDLNPDRMKEANEKGINTASSYKELTSMLEPERLIFMMIPAGAPIDETIEELAHILKPGDTIIDGGNSFYKDSMTRYSKLKTSGINFLDAGMSGGMEGALNGVCSMIGGDKGIFDKYEDLFRKVSVKDGYLYTGKSGSGHFTKMIHNGIEYGMLQAIGEGFEIMQSSDFEYDYKSVSKLWNNGSVIRGWLMELMQSAFEKDENLDEIKGVIRSNGEGLWTAQTALELQVPAPVIAAAVFARFRSMQEDTFSGKVVAALRNEFGGHEVTKA
ncbi:MAG: 6-phosphogluconate dehydrogenase (decarboxylating) [Clostridiales bacterium GWB2_37_7]|nr:MAG: 6-phosphogluconate dehydrogenase (decarboxylating) [Clostridiales bacterium GWB2_37_7]